MTSFLQPLSNASAAAATLVNRRTGAVVADQLIPALDSASRRRGLLHHKSLPDGSAMIIAPTSAIHTFFMKFAIDVAFVSRDGHVRKIKQAIGPWRIAGALRSYAVVELAAGALERSKTQVGDQLVVETRDTRPGQAAPRA
jgi:uncharacterized membrane protein (UPF0127 family)